MRHMKPEAAERWLFGLLYLAFAACGVAVLLAVVVGWWADLVPRLEDGRMIHQPVLLCLS